MGREVRRTPVGYEPPIDTGYFATHVWRHNEWDWTGQGRYFQPQRDQSYEAAITEWIEERAAWSRGEDSYPGDTFEEWYGTAPQPDDYRPEWPADTPLGYQLYETVSEGTPLSPSFATLGELAQFIAPRMFGGDEEAARRFVDAGWAPSAVATTAGVVPGYEWVAAQPEGD